MSQKAQALLFRNYFDGQVRAVGAQWVRAQWVRSGCVRSECAVSAQ
jgi:hypothetical protein